MNCLTNMCYVCLAKKDKSLIDINSSLSVNADIIHIIGYLPCNLGWMKTKPIILICEECCRRLRETYQFLIMCLNNSAVLQGYMTRIDTVSTADNEAETPADVNSKQDDSTKIKCEINSEDEEPCTGEQGPIMKDTEYEFVNVTAWKMEEVDDQAEPPGSSDKETDTEIAVNRNTHDTDTDSDSSEATSTPGQTINTKEPNTPVKKSHKCLTCGKSFSRKSNLQTHTRVHTGEKPYKCSSCNRCFNQRSSLQHHMRIHTGEKPYKCSSCTKCFNLQANLERHMRSHTGEKPYACSRCEKCFSQQSGLLRHMRIHTGEKPYECSKCRKCFNRQGSLVRHMQTHTGAKF